MEHMELRDATQAFSGLFGDHVPENPFPIEPAAPPLDCGLAVVHRAAADAETGGPAGKPAYDAAMRRPPLPGERAYDRLVRKVLRAEKRDATRLARSPSPCPAIGRSQVARLARAGKRPRAAIAAEAATVRQGAGQASRSAGRNTENSDLRWAERSIREARHIFKVRG